MLSQISSYVSRIATKRKQISASKYPAAENENIPRGKNDIMRSSEDSHSHPFENEEFRQLCETKRKKRRIVIAIAYRVLQLQSFGQAYTGSLT